MTDIQQTPEATIQLKRLEYLLSKVTDRNLRTELEREITKLKMNKKFGIVFEEHLPEHVRLYHLPIVVGAKVVIREGKGDDVFIVEEIKKNTASIRHEIDERIEEVPVKELVVIKKFGEPIYPSLIPVDKVQRDKTKPWHTIINAENFHALQLLIYCYERRVDVIYIDPPYNTGSKDWKYNNNYVDNNDQYRHSKWLSMMKRRLIISRKLLSDNGILIVTIDENEHSRLELLIQEIFPDCSITTVAIVHNPRGIQGDNFSYTNEFALFVIPKGIKAISKRDLDEDKSKPLMKTGTVSRRKEGKTMFYPIYVKDNVVVRVGEVPKDEFHPKSANVKLKDGTIEIWPIDSKGGERKWRYKKTSLEQILDMIEVKSTKNGISLNLKKNTESYRTVWNESEYDAAGYGSSLIKKIVDCEFPFPKSLYAVKDCIKAVAKNRPNALIVDFFAGSGTTLHATCLLNSEDEGNRRCILITNNEVEAKLAEKLAAQGIYPSDSRYEKNGICEAITWPRCKFSINGKRDDGTKLPGEYLTGRKFSEGFAENIQYFRLDYLDPYAIEYREKLADILPMLWMTAGSKGVFETLAKEKAWFMPDNSTYAILLDESQFAAFKKALKERSNITHVFLVTDSEEAYRDMCGNLPPNLQFKMLYHSYLENFRINIPQEL